MKDAARYSRIIFGTGTAKLVSMETLSRRTGIPRETLCRYRRDPTKIPLDRLMAIDRVVGIDWERMRG